MTPVTPARSVGRSVSRSVGLSVCRSIGTVLLAVICASCALQAQSNLTVAAAANLGPALREITANFGKRSGTHVELVFGSSGNLASQIENGAPFDVFLSADVDYPRRLEAKGAAASGSLAVYATGKLVLWVTNASGIDLGRLQPQMLLLDSVHKIAIANPQHAPYGKAAVEFLRKAGLYDRVAGKFVLGEDVAQTAEFVRSGNADVGIIPLSLALAPAMKERGKYREIAADSYTPIRQAGVILKHAKNPSAAAKFLAYVRSAEAAAVLARYGFDPPAEEHK
jgi:molybdate transport system substrate-binding protein